MALIPVRKIAPQVRQTRSAKKGGQLGGALAGAALGAAAIGLAPATGGASVAAAPTAAAILGGAATGASLGGLVGGALAPAQSAQFTQSPQIQNLSTVQLGSMSNQLLASLQSLEQFPQMQQEFARPLVQAYMGTQIALKNKDIGSRGGLA